MFSNYFLVFSNIPMFLKVFSFGLATLPPGRVEIDKILETLPPCHLGPGVLFSFSCEGPFLRGAQKGQARPYSAPFGGFLA